MTEQAMVVVGDGKALALQNIVDKAYEFSKAATSKNTRRTYAAGWKSFIGWCRAHGTDHIAAPEKEALIAFYASDSVSKKDGDGGIKVSSLNCYVAAICAHYQAIGIVINIKHPAVATVLKGIRKSLPKRPIRKEPILTEDLLPMIQAIQVEKNGAQHLIGIRDRAILLLGFAGAFRRSELVALTMADLSFKRDGVIALVRQSKTDQEGEGHEKMIAYGANPLTCAVRALKDWLDAAGITDGPVFRNVNRHGQIAKNPLAGNAVARIIKRNDHIADKTKYGGHSLRAGFVTSGVERGVAPDLLMAQTGHKHVDTLNMYVRRGKSFAKTASALVGL